MQFLTVLIQAVVEMLVIGGVIIGAVFFGKHLKEKKLQKESSGTEGK